MTAKQTRIITPAVIDEERAAKALALSLGKKLNCPACGSEKIPSAYFSGRFCRCKACGKKYTWRTGTIFEGAKLTAAQLILMLDAIAAGATDRETADYLELTPETVKLWRFKFGLIGIEGKE